MAKIFRDFFFNFYLILDYYKIRTRVNFESPNRKSLDLHLIMRFMPKELFSGSTDLTEAIFKIPEISKHFSAMLVCFTKTNHKQENYNYLHENENCNAFLSL